VHTDEPLRRRSPAWVRALPLATLHAIPMTFDRRRRTEDLTGAQEWLYDACVSELSYRRRHTRPVWRACSCYLCFDPFPD
jgi:hypothetical protein